MKLTFANDRVLAVMAHPDDAELLCAGTLARARADGAAIGICVMCQGDKGLASGRRVTDLGKVRRREAQAAAKVLGAQFFWFGERDGDLQDEIQGARARARKHAPSVGRTVPAQPGSG